MLTIEKSHIDSELLKMPIDQFGRYHIVSSIIKQLYSNNSVVNILDIGGYNGSLHKFFNNDKVQITVLDTYNSNEPNYVKGNALNLPFNDNQFDAVVSFEVFEHIPRADRETYLKEAIRVSKGPFILTAPFSGEQDEVAKSEVMLNDLWKHIHHKDHLWLKEHIEFKTPKAKELETLISKQKQPFKKIGNNDLLLWNLMMSLAFITTIYRDNGSQEKVQEFYNKHLDSLESGEDNFYRYIYVIGEASSKLDIQASISSQSKKSELINELIIHTFTALATDIKQIKLDNNKLLKKHSKLELDINLLTKEIQDIKNSSSWRLAKRISKARKIVPRKKGVK